MALLSGDPRYRPPKVGSDEPPEADCIHFVSTELFQLAVLSSGTLKAGTGGIAMGLAKGLNI
jgi:hypothetical protein